MWPTTGCWLLEVAVWEPLVPILAESAARLGELCLDILNVCREVLALPGLIVALGRGALGLGEREIRWEGWEAFEDAI